MDLAAIIISVIALVIGNSYFILGYVTVDSLGLDGATIMAFGIIIAIIALVLSIISIIYNKVNNRKMKKSVIALVLSILGIISPIFVFTFTMIIAG